MRTKIGVRRIASGIMCVAFYMPIDIVSNLHIILV